MKEEQLRFLIKDTEVDKAYKAYRYNDIYILGSDVEFKANVAIDRLTEIQVLKENGAERIKSGFTYSLWKDGRLYYVLGVGIHNETLEKYIVYQALYGEGEYYARPIDIFISKVDPSRQADNETGQQYRFEQVSRC